MKVSVIGTGSIGMRHLQNCLSLRHELKLTEVQCFDTDSNRLAAAQKSFPEVKITSDLQQAVAGVDAVFICVPTSRHLEVIHQISKFGTFHLYLEKPFSHTLEGCEELVWSQKKSKKVLTVGYFLPFHPVLRKVKGVLEEERLGRVLSVYAESGFYLPFWHPKEDYRNFYMAWKQGGGGVLLDTSHEINYLQGLFGNIVEVKGYFGKISDLEISSDDFSAALFLFENGVYGHLHLDLLQFQESRFCKIIGTEGVLVADLMKNSVKISTRKSPDWSEENLTVDFNQLYLSQVKNFFRACNDQPAELISGEWALATMHVIEAIRRSNAYSSAVRIPLYD